MDAAHMHLLLNHIPVIGTAVGLFLLAWGLWRTSDELKKVSLSIFIISAVIAIPTYLTGESAEELVEHLSGVSESLIERHEDAAVLAVAALELLGLAAAVTLVLFQRAHRAVNMMLAASLVLALVTGGLMARTANLGGQIRHTEIRPLSSSPVRGLAHRHMER